MKKIVLGFLALLFITNTFAQKSQYVKQPSFGIHFFYNDFNTATALRTVSLGEVLRAKDWSRTKYMEPGFALSYIEGLGEHMDFAGTLSTSVMDNRMMFELVATANLKLTSDKHCVSPFITLGAGAQKHGGYFGALIPAGLGLQVNLWNEAFLLVNSQYRMPVTENVKYHLYHSIGIAGNLYKRKLPEPVKLPEVTPPPPPPVKDTDGDGITDDQDKCPEVKGLAKYNGCPVPDTDGDGVNDEADKCPDVKGLVRYNGCPIPDTDGDGINDEEDKCPKEAGVAANFGCPEIAKEVVEKINMAAKDVFFATGSAKLLPKSSKSLDEIVKILKDNPTYSLDVNGYTDNTGTVERNLELSKERAASVVAYITAKGISADRLHSEGFGVERPVADNKTAAGRAKNRRVEMIVKNY